MEGNFGEIKFGKFLYVVHSIQLSFEYSILTYKWGKIC